MKRSKPIHIELAAFQVKALASLNRRVNAAAKKGQKPSIIAQVYLNDVDEMTVRFLDEEATLHMIECFKAVKLEK
jgi:hypothetical protein